VRLTALITLRLIARSGGVDAWRLQVGQRRARTNQFTAYLLDEGV
jgi:hypothetical protein